MYRRLSALLMAFCMIFGLVGCTAPGNAPEATTAMSDGVLDAAGVWEKMCQAVGGRSASAFTSTIEMGADIDTGLVPLEAGATAVTDLVLSQEPFRYYASTEVQAKLFGKDFAGSFELYTASGSSGLDTYIHLVNGDSWYHQHTSMVPTDLLDQYGITACNGKWTPKNLTLAAEPQSLNGESVYVLNSSFAASDVLRAINSPVGEISFEKMDLSGLELMVTYYVDTDSYLPVQIDIRYQGIGALIGDLLTKYAGEIMGSMAASLKVDVTTYREVLSGLVYDPVEVPQVPAQGVQNSKDMKEISFSDIKNFFG